MLESPLPRSARRDYGLPVDAFIFACFNRLFKLDDVTFALWMQILQRTPNSVLWLLRVPPFATLFFSCVLLVSLSVEVNANDFVCSYLVIIL